MSNLFDLDYTSNNFFKLNLDERVLSVIDGTKNKNFRDKEKINITKNIRQNNFNQDRTLVDKTYNVKVINTNTSLTKAYEDDYISKNDNINEGLNKNFANENIKGFKHREINLLNQVNSNYNNLGANAINFFDYKNSSNRPKKVTDLENFNQEEIENKNHEEIKANKENFQSKLVFANTDYKKSNNYLINGINIEHRQDKIKHDPKIKTIKHYANTLNNKSLTNEADFILKNHTTNVLEKNELKQQKKIEKEIEKNQKEILKHLNNNAFVLREVYHTRDKYLNSKNCSDCTKCQLKERINKKFDYQFKEKNKIYDGEVNNLILEVKQCMKRKTYEVALSLLDSYFLSRKGSKEAMHSDLFYLKGEIYRLKGDYKSGEENFLECLRYECHPNLVYYSLGQLYLSQIEFLNENNCFTYDLEEIFNKNKELKNKLKDAYKVLEKYNQLCPNSHSGFYLSSKALCFLNEYEDALQLISQSIILLTKGDLEFVIDIRNGSDMTSFEVNKILDCVRNYFLLRQKIYLKLGLEAEAKQDIEYLKKNNL